MRYSIEPRTRKYVKGYEFLSFAKKYKKQLLDKGLDASKRVVHKAREYLGNKITDVITKSNDDNNDPTNICWSSRRLQDMSWRCLQHVISVTVFRPPRRLQDVFKTSLEDISKDVLEDEKLLQWRLLQEVLGINEMFTGISISNHGLLRNLNKYLTNHISRI